MFKNLRAAYWQERAAYHYKCISVYRNKHLDFIVEYHQRLAAFCHENAIALM